MIHALNCLEEHREFLPKTLVQLLAPHGCQALGAEGLSVAVESAKDAVRSSLADLSVKMVEGVLKRNPVAEELLQLCRSTELNALLKEDLEQKYVLKPISAKLAPRQGGCGPQMQTL